MPALHCKAAVPFQSYACRVSCRTSSPMALPCCTHEEHGFVLGPSPREVEPLTLPWRGLLLQQGMRMGTASFPTSCQVP